MDGWHLKKEIALGNIITLIVVIISGLWWVAGIEKRLSLVEHRTVEQEKRIERDVADIKQMLTRIEDRINSREGR